MNKEQGNPSSL